MEAWKEICRALVEKYLPHEADFFDVTWDAVQELGIDKIALGGSDEAITELGGIGTQEGQQLDSAGLVALFSVVAYHLQESEEEKTIELIGKTIEKAAGTLKVPRFVENIFLNQPGIFADAYGAVDWEKDKIVKPAHAGDYWVVSCERYNSYFDKDDIDKEWYSKKKTRTEFIDRCSEYVLFVNEERKEIFVRKPLRLRKEGEVPQDSWYSDIPERVTWNLPPRESTLLYLVLEAFASGTEELTWERMCSVVMGLSVTKQRKDGISKVRGELNKKLLGFFDEVIGKSRGVGYRIECQLWFCWIRRNSRKSALLKKG